MLRDATWANNAKCAFVAVLGHALEVRENFQYTLKILILVRRLKRNKSYFEILNIFFSIQYLYNFIVFINQKDDKLHI